MASGKENNKKSVNLKSIIKKAGDSRWFIWTLLGIIIIIQLANVTNFILNYKTSYHSDEVFSYGLSNSFYQLFINADRVYEDTENYKNVNEWIDGDLLRNYITVQKGEQFRYDSVWHNQKMDRHPPFYYAVIHTICSFIPDKFSLAVGYGVNFVCFAIMQIYIYKLLGELMRSRWLGLLSCTAWGFCSASINNLVFIRMYCMLAMFMVMFIYMHHKTAVWVLSHTAKSSEKDSETKPENLPKKLVIQLIAVTTLGALTQHMFLIAAFAAAICFCFWLLFEKCFRIFFEYGFTLLGSALLSILIFPATIDHFFFEGDVPKGTEVFFKQLELSWNYFMKNCFSMRFSILVTFLIYVLVGIAVVLIFSVPLMYLMRDKFKPKERFKLFIKNLREAPSKAINRIKEQGMLNYFRSLDPTMLVIFAVVGISTASVCYQINFLLLALIDRYYFMIYPIVFIFFVYLVYLVLPKIKFKKLISAVLLLLITVNVILNSSYVDVFQNKGTLKNISDFTSGASVISVELDITDDCMVNFMSTEMFDVSHVFMTNPDDLPDCIDELNDNAPKNEKFYVFISDAINYYDNGDMTGEEKIQQQIDLLKTTDIINDMDYMGTYYIFNRCHRIYECT